MSNSFPRQVLVLGLLSLLILVPFFWFTILSAVVYGGAFVADVFDPSGDIPRIIAGIAGLLLSIITVLGLLVLMGGVVLTSLARLGKWIWARFAAAD